MKLTKKQQVEQTAKELFRKQGFKKVTIDEICRKANVSRKSFYTFYGNKTALVLYLLKQMTDDAFAATRRIMEGEGSFPDKLERMLQLKFDGSKEFSMEFMADLYNPDATDIHEYFNRIVDESIILMRDFYREAQEKGEMNPEINLDYVIWMMQKQVELCKTEELMAMFPTVESMTRQISQSIIYGIMPVKNNA